MSFRFADVCAGIGGFRKAAESVGGECVWTCELDAKARITYRANFGECEIAEDVFEAEPSSLPPIDLLLAGFPCQPFSTAGKARLLQAGKPIGMSCDRGQVFFGIARLLEAAKPPYVLLENVPRLRTFEHEGVNAFSEICSALIGLGYWVSSRVYSAQGHVPQNRKRLFILGSRGGMVPNIHIDDRPGPLRLGDILEGEVRNKYLLKPYLWKLLQKINEENERGGKLGFRYSICPPEGIARTLTAHYATDYREILIGVEGADRPRRLTPRECSRLMGFDTPQGSDWEIPVSDHQAYRQFGNAVVPPLAAELIRGLVAA